jgi:hypothetical protein
MKRILMILTHNRLDCLRIALEMLDRGGHFSRFDKVVFLLNGVSPRHLAYVEAFIAARPGISWDKLFGPGTRPDGISFLQNACVKKYPESIYVKVDEDVFVPDGWSERMLEAYRLNQHREDLALITPLISNNAYGLHFLLTRFHPELLREYRDRFGGNPEPRVDSATSQNPRVGEWATRKFIDINEANRLHRELSPEIRGERFHAFNDRFSIGCICYDYRHWTRMGGIPREDEPAWCAWVQGHGATHILDTSQIVLHYSFFVQQDWLDRTSLLEDLRLANLPATLSRNSLTGYHLRRWIRIARQVPRALLRRIRLLTGFGAN